MAIQLKKASRSQVKLKIAVAGASGSGKTMGSLLVAYGLIKAEHPDWNDAQIWESICVIDTENGSGSLYVGTTVDRTTIGEYQTIDLDPPFEAKRYVEAIHVAEDAGMQVIIIDSLTHAWTGVGGALDTQGKIAARTGNSWTAWRDVTPEHNKLVDAMLQSKAHVIACMRAKQEYVQEKNDRGKSVVKAVGMGVQMREGVEYEFTTCFMLDYSHIANATKDRTGMFDGQYITLSPEVGKKFYEWLNTNKAEAPRTTTETPKPQVQPASEVKATADSPERIAKAHEAIKALVAKQIENVGEGQTTADRQKEIGELIFGIAGTRNYLKVNDLAVLTKIYEALK